MGEGIGIGTVVRWSEDRRYCMGQVVDLVDDDMLEVEESHTGATFEIPAADVEVIRHAYPQSRVRAGTRF